MRQQDLLIVQAYGDEKPDPNLDLLQGDLGNFESSGEFQEMMDFRLGKCHNITFSKADTNSGHIPQQNGGTWRDNVNQCSIDQDNVSALSGWPKQHQEGSQEASPQRYQNISKWFVSAKPTRSCQRDMVSSQVSYQMSSAKSLRLDIAVELLRQERFLQCGVYKPPSDVTMNTIVICVL